MKCILIEDEIPAQKVLRNYIDKLDNLEFVGAFQSAIAANPFLKKNEVDLIFMDINLPDITGIEYIRTLTNPPQVIMTTAYPNYAVESYELDAVRDYLVKPFSFERFLKAVNRVRTGMREKESYEDKDSRDPVLFVNVDKTLHRIRAGEILYIESEKNYVTIVTRTNRLSYIDSLKNWLDRLPQDLFVQTHKSYIVNLREVEQVNGNRLTVKGIRLPLGRTYKTTFMQRLHKG
ncbi:LytR/AlgR family response regulator transcription factor [Poritiphilus flavus]|uniref:Response regulator n=1 Tax=Poritiphilus flavus TaxID=2697053 RepID=A0A6L9E8J0_9FLAO|nr:LytTR family DNA-binding domain-containing protein [Poritiphilus flavus]NAS10908.1 response regulator [Poritiphilus flavus]